MKKRNILINWFYAIAFLSIFCLMLADKNQAQVTVNSRSSNGTQNILTSSTLTWQHTVSSCTNCVLYVGVSTYTSVTVPSARVLSVTYGTQSLTRIGTQVAPTDASPGNSAVELFRLIGPETGTKTVTVSFAGLGDVSTINYAFGGSISLAGVSQTSSNTNTEFSSSSGTSDSPTLSITGGVNGDLALDIVGIAPGGGNLAQRSNQIVCTDEMSETTCLRGRRFFNDVIDVGAIGVKNATTGTIALNWQSTNSSKWALGGIVVRQSVATSSPASIGGQVKTKFEQSLKNVLVTLYNIETGEVLYKLTDDNGFYTFEGLKSLNLYHIKAYSNFYNFTPADRTLNLTESIGEVDFYGSIRNRKKSFLR